MEDCFIYSNYDNSYVNVPIFILKTYWAGDEACFRTFILNILAFGTATQQIMRFEEAGNDGCKYFSATTTSAENNIELFINFINETERFRQTNNYYQTFYDLVCKYQEWLRENYESEWTIHTRWVGITIYNLHRMILSFSESDLRKSPERNAQKWLIYFGLKSIIHPKPYFECSWDFILCRAMGFNSRKDYEIENISDADWTIPFRTKRRTKMKMIERLTNEFGLVYTATRYKGCNGYKCRWSLQKNTSRYK